MTSGPTRPRIAFLVDYLCDAFQTSVWSSVVAAAREEGADLLCFLGGVLLPDDDPRGGQRGRNAVYDLVSPATVDGIIALSGSIGCFIPEAELAALYGRYAPLPLLSLCGTVGDAPSLYVDNASGVGDVVDHLVAAHGRRRIAFVRGPRTSVDAELRYAAYREALDRHGIRFDPAYVYDGDFQRPSGIQAVRAFLDERRLPLDALVAANDNMALYALSELERRGVAVPDRIAVAGFDDVMDAAIASPALTSVHQPIEEMGRRAVRTLLAMLRGEQVPREQLLPSRLVTRRSCGCHPDLPDGASSGSAEVLSPTAAALAAAMERAAHGLEPGWAAPLADSLLASISGAPAGELLGRVEALLAGAAARGLAIERYRDGLRAGLRALRAACADRDAALRLAATTEAVLSLFSRVVANAETALRIRDREEVAILERIFQPPNLTEEAFRRALVDGLPTLGVRSFVLCRYRGPDARTAEVWARVGPERPAEVAPGPFPAYELTPGGFQAGEFRAHAVLPIHYVDQRIGYAVCALGSLGPNSLETMSTQLGTSFKVFELVDEVRQDATRLEAKVQQRTRELREAQRRLVEAAHEAGMAEVAVGALHNVGNLLNSVSVSAEQVADLARSPHVDGLARARELLAEHRRDLAAFFVADPRAAVFPEYLGRITDGLAAERSTLQEESRQLLERVSVIRETIRALQDLARQRPQSVLRDRIDAASLLDAALTIQAGALQRQQVRVERYVQDGLPELVSERSKLLHVLVNLVKNAVDAMRGTPPGARTLTLSVEARAEDRLRFTVADTGEGISPENLERIFSYGFTTKLDGNGFGLHTSALHARQLGGSLEARSEGPGRGAAFTLEIPISATQG